MKIKRIFSFFFSVLFILNFCQNNPPEEKKWKYEPNFVVGLDVLNSGLSVFRDRKIFQGFVSSRLRKNLHAVLDVGYESNIYLKNGYDAGAKGPYLKAGTFYMITTDPENSGNGFYGGGKMAASFYSQEYRAVPVRGFGGNNSSLSLPASRQSSYWLEGVVGGRIQLFNTNIYVDANLQPRFLLFTTKQDDLQPMIVPGFGTSASRFGIGYSWNIAYRF